MQTLKISVVTVCLNTVDTIVNTIESVLCQTYENIEYVIMDGQSTDGTLEKIRKYEDSPQVKVISEKDSGLYNAMNKAVDVCSGDYIIFLNSGDVFAGNTVIADAVVQITKGKNITNQKSDHGSLPDIFYSNVIKIYENGRVVEKYPGKHTVFKLLMMGKMPCHQGIFASTSVLRRYGFDESYRICADFDFLLRGVRNHVKMQYLDVDVSIVDCVMGISSQNVNLDKMRAEDDRSIKKNYPLIYYLMWIPKKIVRSKGKKN